MRSLLFFSVIFMTVNAFADAVVSTCPDPGLVVESPFVGSGAFGASLEPILVDDQFSRAADLLRKKLGTSSADAFLDNVIESVPKVGKARAFSALEAIARVRNLKTKNYLKLYADLVGGST
jgi:hypothetical protein